VEESAQILLLALKKPCIPICVLADNTVLHQSTLIDTALKPQSQQARWTECLPLLYRSRETVLAAFQRARTLFPFPILGIDTDNGGEFLNEDLVTYCEQEHITLTRGRPYQKRDQCYVEQFPCFVVSPQM
jgi:hypothetical protein